MRSRARPAAGQSTSNAASPVVELYTLLACEPARLSRLAQWLLAQSGNWITPDTLGRDCGVVAPTRAPVVYRLLCRAGILLEATPGRARLDPAQLARTLAAWLETYASDGDGSAGDLVWTLPALREHGNPAGESSIRDLIFDVICGAEQWVWIVSPFIDAEGIDAVVDPIRAALRRNVVVTLITHNLENMASANSRAVAWLCHATAAINHNRRLRIYSVNPSAAETMLIHAKLVTADGRRGYLGTANLTGHGLGLHIEAGVALTRRQVRQVETRLQRVVASDLVSEIGTVELARTIETPHRLPPR